MYTIMNATKMVTVTKYDAAAAQAGSTTDTASQTFVETGKAEFAGAQMDYDKYKVGDAELLYFVQGGALKGIRTVAAGQTVDIEYEVFDTNVPDDVFAIPADYQQITM
ncbi:MAG: hypothetical protein LBJ11_09805 [Oscillospiraceae bacterium]|nr:hypothetical protein [Oscillospiraceae bacterium]